MRISIIIPVYNCEKYIKKCIDSIIEQTYRGFELIIINDGSTDNTTHLLEEYKKYNYIRIINQDNKGVSHARNNGIANAQGEYLCFIDGDDYIDKDFLFTLINENLENKYDWVLSGIYDFHENTIIKEIKYKEQEWDINNIDECINFYSLKLLTAPFPKLFKKNIILKNNLKFNTNISLAEDREFNYQYAQYIHKVKTISYTGYYYRVSNPNSLSKKCYPYKLKYDCLHWDIIWESFQNRKFQDSRINELLVNKIFHSINDNIKQLAYSYNIKDALTLLSENVKYIDKIFIKRNKALIKSSIWLIYIITNTHYKILLLFHYLLKTINSKK